MVQILSEQNVSSRSCMNFYSNESPMKSYQGVSDFCSTQGIQWDFTPEHAPHFSRLWESAVKSLKTQLHWVIGISKLNFKEVATVLTQIEACLNNHPLGVIPHYNDEGIEVLTHGHFLIGHPIEAIPNHDFSYSPISLLCCWYLCEALVQHFWKRWQEEYLTSLRRFSKWCKPNKNLEIGDITVLREDNTMPTHWPVTRITEVHKGQDGLVRVVKLQIKSGVYTRPVTKVSLLLPCLASNWELWDCVLTITVVMLIRWLDWFFGLHIASSCT